MKKVAIIQSNYIPWKGYFDIINDVDLFIFYDDVQYTKNDWRNRNQLKADNGTCWLTIPIGSNLSRLIYEVTLENSYWQAKHWKTITHLYYKAPYFKRYSDFFRHIYLEKVWTNLSELNQTLIQYISREILGIKTEFQDSRQYNLAGAQLDRLLDLLVKANADAYISGPTAKAYLDEQRFQEIGIDLHYKDYSNYPNYKQMHSPFEHNVSILDVLFNCGPNAPYYIWEWRKSTYSTLKEKTLTF